MLNKLKNKSILLFDKMVGTGELKTDRGEGYVDTIVKVIMGLMLGGLLLTFFSDTFQNTIFPTVTQKFTDMFS